ncbi:MAG: triosephosphate isomerase [Richelia sp. RM2_1_2]|nr:triosephosphate isomerase [Richelia sp. RM2_1_2]
MGYKKYTSHKDVKIGDIIIFKCMVKPQNKTLHLNYGKEQIWIVNAIEHKGVLLRKKNRKKQIEMILHDYKIDNSHLTIKYEGENYVFTLYYSEVFSIIKFIRNLISKLKKTKMSGLIRIIYGFILIVCSLILESTIFGLAFSYGWNMTMPRLFGLPTLLITDGIVLIFLTRIVTFNMGNFMNNTAPSNNPPVIKITHLDEKDLKNLKGIKENGEEN